MGTLADFRRAALSIAALLITSSSPTFADDGERLLSIDHYVTVKSTVPSIVGQPAEIYVHERAKASTISRASGGDRVVLFIHGAGTPAEVAFDVPY